MNKQLEAVAEEFTRWRRSRVKRGHTPQSLIKKTLSLRDQVSDAQIVKYLGINKTALTRWASQKHDYETPAQFVELPTSTLPVQPNLCIADRADMPTLNIALSSGVSLSLSGESQALANFVVQLTERGAL